MRTTVDLPSHLLAIALELGPTRTKREVLTTELEEYVKRRLREELRRKRGTEFLDLTHEELQRMRPDEEPPPARRRPSPTFCTATFTST